MSLLVEKKKKIPSDLRQNLLELVAYYNESEAIEDGDETRQVWTDSNEHDILRKKVYVTKNQENQDFSLVDFLMLRSSVNDYELKERDVMSNLTQGFIYLWLIFFKPIHTFTGAWW